MSSGKHYATYEKRKDDQLLNLVLKNLETSDKKLDKIQAFQLKMHDLCQSREVMIDKTIARIDSHLDWHEKKKLNGANLKKIGCIGLLKHSWQVFSGLLFTLHGIK